MRPLDGVRVVDLTRLLPGNFATLLLSDLGADVIKVEDPRGGDHARHMPPLVDGTSVYFRILNRNKRSVTLDLRVAEASSILDRLLAGADIVIDSFRPSAARRLGVDPETLRSKHPRLICASITGFGRSGPYVDRAAHDINYEALAGLLGLRETPIVPPLLVADVGSAWQAVAEILAALIARQRTGTGAVIDISLHEAALAWMQFPAAPSLVEGKHTGVPISLTGGAARYNLYQAGDDEWLALGALEEKFWVGFCRRIGRPDLLGPMAEATRIEEVRRVMKTRSRDEWLADFADEDVCLTAVYTVQQALADPHVEARGVVVRDETTTYVTPAGVRVTKAPTLGEHTDEVLRSIGVSADEVVRLREAGAI